MSQGRSQNIGASVRQRLLNLAKAQKEDFQGILTRYALERLLYRLSSSEHASRFVLKGAMLFSVWGGDLHRATRDLDMLSMGDNSVEGMAATVTEICLLQVPDDGIEFLPGSINSARIKEGQEYQGVRLNLSARLAGAIIPVQIDVGFGDAITPPPERKEFPSLLDLPTPRLLIYPPETVVAEKVQAMVALDRANSRLKDFYDLWILSRKVPFDGRILGQALEATFNRRRTPIPDGDSFILNQEVFVLDPAKQLQWEAFLRKSNLVGGDRLFKDTVEELNRFLTPVLEALREETHFDLHWLPGGSWSLKPNNTP